MNVEFRDLEMLFPDFTKDVFLDDIDVLLTPDRTSGVCLKRIANFCETEYTNVSMKELKRYYTNGNLLKCGKTIIPVKHIFKMVNELVLTGDLKFYHSTKETNPVQIEVNAHFSFCILTAHWIPVEVLDSNERPIKEYQELAEKEKNSAIVLVPTKIRKLRGM